MTSYGTSVERTCESCGRHPAVRLTVRRHVGLLVAQRFVTVRPLLCRRCGADLVRSFTLRTLVQGWWGLISFFYNWFVLLTNGAAWFRLRRLAEPSVSGTEGHVSVAAGLAGGLEEAAETSRPPKTSRSRRRFALLAAVAIVLGVVGLASTDTSEEHDGPHGTPLSVAQVEVGLTSAPFYTEEGAAFGVLAADCDGLPRDAAVTFTHFRCFMTFTNRAIDETMVHVLPGGELFFVARL